MAASCGSEPIDDDEVVFRRVAKLWLNGTKPSPQAFLPTVWDDTGLSLSRAKYVTAEEVGCSGRPGKAYYVAFLKAGDLRVRGIEIVPRPRSANPGHCEIPGLRYEKRNDDFTGEASVLLATELCLDVQGPFRKADDL